MGRRKSHVAEDLEMRRKFREANRDDEKYVRRCELEHIIWWIEKGLSRCLDKRKPNVQWLGERLILRRKLADMYLELTDGKYLFPEDHAFF